MSNTPKVKLFLSFGNVDRLSLSIPLAECGTFAVNPLRWLRFLGFAIYGRQGYLSTSRSGPEINDYTAKIEARAYYFISGGEPRLVDVDAVDDRTSDASDLSALREGFRAGLIERDGTCVITNDLPRNSIACHILPHAKGSEYMVNVVDHRGDAYEPVDGLDNINDVRNGLLLINILHRPLGDGELAFLKTPNFALAVDDIPYRHDHDPKENPTSRLTLQYFISLPRLGTVIPIIAPPNTDVREPEDTSSWPPAIIVDQSYAAAALKAWSSKSFMNYVRQKSRKAYYDDSGNALAGGQGHAQMSGQAARQSGSGRSRRKTSNIPTDQLTERELYLELMDGVCALWMESAKAAKPKLEGVRASARNDDVKKWLESMEDSMSQ